MLNKMQIKMKLHYVLDITKGVFFVDEEDTLGFIFGQDEWNDMGSPLTITVTVEPGDRLND